MKITIECTEEQANIIEKSLENTFRPLMNQWSDLADLLAGDTYTYNKYDPDNDIKFDKYLERRNNIETKSCWKYCVWRILSENTIF